jgi:hypothetical protein
VNVRAATDKELEQGYAGGIGLWVNEADLSDDDVASNPDLEPSKRIH